MAQRQGCCSCFGKRHDGRVEPEKHEPVILRNDQIEPAPTRDLPKPPKNTENEPTTLSPPARLQPAENTENEPTTLSPPARLQPADGGRSTLGEGLEGRINTIPDEEFRERNGALRIHKETDEKATKLITKAINFHHEENRKAHRTDDYEIQELIIRRGQTFEITVTFNREYNPKDDVIIVQFVTGNRPQESKGSIMRVAIQDQLTPAKWGMQVKETKGNDVSLSIMSASKAIIGKYELYVETKSKDSSGEIAMSRYQDKKPIYILFNAWCQEDTVYMESDEHCKEYVLEDFGYIWTGTSSNFSPLPWAFDQFEDVALYSALWLLDKAKLFSHNRTSPVEISRTISAMSNSNNADGGVLSGRWSNDYPEGTTNPLDWTGSGPVLEEFWTTKKTVKYGQCWVFSGLVTTLMRALGIPTRSVTNFDSAHDKDASMTIDYHFDEEGDMIHHMNDFEWNFHVWNESWFRRPDLPLGHDGWQVYDATPQETSQGVFRCGPASVKAVKKGEVYLPYDTGFVFAEVNGDRVHWVVNKEDGSMKPTNVSKNIIGSFISTKAVGSHSRDDITQEYKYPEGSDEERKAVHLAFQFSSRTEHELYDTSVVEDVQFRLETEDRIDPGQSFEVTVVAKNNSEVAREIKVNLAAVLNFYTGVPAKKMKTYKLKFLLNSRAEKRLSLKIEPSDYITPKATVGDSYVQLYVKGVVPETGQSFVDQKMVGFTKQKIHIEPSPKSAKVGDEVELTGIFKNPLPVPLTKGHFFVQATRMKPRTIRIDCKGPVGVNEEARFSAKFTVARKGFHRISARFNSTELKDVPGECVIGSD